jgi:hypothetical protein
LPSKPTEQHQSVLPEEARQMLSHQVIVVCNQLTTDNFASAVHLDSCHIELRFFEACNCNKTEIGDASQENRFITSISVLSPIFN